MASLLIIGAVTVVITNYKQVHELNIFAAVLVVQSLPFLAAAGLAVIERTRLNEFAYWRGIEARVTDLLPIARREATMTEATRTAPVQKPGELVQ